MANGSSGSGVGGGSAPSGSSVPKMKRLWADLIDLVGVPIILGFSFGFLLLVLQAPDQVNTIVLIVVNVGWLIIRDKQFSPGRNFMGLKLIATDGRTGISYGQAFIRNILLVFPGVLLLGYPIELIAVFFVKGDRIMDGLAKTKVVTA